MTPFPKHITLGEKYGPAMAITDQGQADAYFERCVQHSIEFAELDRQAAVNAERANLGYYAGYYGQETRERVERLFGGQHPIFGSASRQTTPLDALVAGIGAGGGESSKITRGEKS